MAIHQEYECDDVERHFSTAPRADDAKAAANTAENRAGKPCPIGWCKGRTWAVGAGSVALNEAGKARLAKNRERTAHLRPAVAV